jgi:hypothetical protein
LIRVDSGVADAIHHFLTLDNFPYNRVFSRKPLGGCKAYEKLRAIAIRAGIRQSYDATFNRPTL